MAHPVATGAALAAAPAAAAAIRRRRILVNRRLDLWLDAAILAGFTFAYSFGFTGLAVHEWLGLALGLILLVHLTCTGTG
jgi:hypothetical protein